MIHDMGVADVTFMGTVTQAELNACYKSAHVFLCMSEHEGFCIPLMEAMWHDVPVLAFAAAAVPETMDGAGCLFRDKAYPAVAEMMGRLARDRTLREAVLAEQRRRVTRFMARDLAGELKQHLAEVLPAP